MGVFPFKEVRAKLRLSTNCWGAIAAISLTAMIFGTLLILKYAAPLPTAHKGRVREYYIAAEEIQWDYTPLQRDPMTGATWNGSIVASKKRAVSQSNSYYYLGNDLELAVQSGLNRIGHIYWKARYVEYTSATFGSVKPRSAEDQHLGILGPILRAEVGDLIRVYFYNACPFYASIHPHALFYLRSDEGVPMGAQYDGHTDHTHAHQTHKRQFANHANHGGNDDDPDLVIPPISLGRGDGSLVAPSSLHVYEWQVPERAGPGENDPSSVLWPYHSHVDETADPNAGLMGAFIITRTGSTRSVTDLRPKEVDREIVLSLSVFDENASKMLNLSMAPLVKDMNTTERTALLNDPLWQMSNIKHSINGYLYNNLPGLVMKANETVRWHLFTLGDEKDLHGAHWHGSTLLLKGKRTDSIELLPGLSQSADMVPDMPGEWMVHCHTSHHFKAGMSAAYIVQSCDGPCPLHDQRS